MLDDEHHRFKMFTDVSGAHLSSLAGLLPKIPRGRNDFLSKNFEGGLHGDCERHAYRRTFLALMANLHKSGKIRETRGSEKKFTLLTAVKKRNGHWRSVGRGRSIVAMGGGIEVSHHVAE